MPRDPPPTNTSSTTSSSPLDQTDPYELPAEINDLFPYASYRDHQREILTEAYAALFEEGYQTVVIDAPTGIGKSAINTVLARAASSTFLTTPQKKLRRQLEDDTDLSRHYTVLRARADYSCYNGYNCSDCPINEDPDLKCSDIPEIGPGDPTVTSYDMNGEPDETLVYPEEAAAMESCRYWSEKQRAMEAQTAVLTPSYLYVDGKLPDTVSFSDRDLLIIDECHSLAEQAASLWAGFSLSPNTLPDDVYDAIADDLDESMWRFEDIAPILETAEQEAREYMETHQAMVEDAVRDPGELTGDADVDVRKGIDQCLTFLDHVETIRAERASGREWVVEVDGYSGSSRVLKARLLPTEVDQLLTENIWSRANQYVLSTATLPYRGNPRVWLDSLGLDPDRAKVISKPMPFPTRNRVVNTGHMVGHFSGGDDYTKHWDGIVEAVERIATRHGSDRGLIHTVSYDRAAKLAAALDDELPVLVHRNDEGEGDDYYLDRWQDSETPERILLSPSLTEGVDLPDDACRWQILLKVPYMQSSRTQFKLKVQKDWNWYYDRTAREIIQAAGRGVRHDEDYCTFYVLDEAFNDVRERATFPRWFLDAITDDPEVDHHYFGRR